MPASMDITSSQNTRLNLSVKTINRFLPIGLTLFVLSACQSFVTPEQTAKLEETAQIRSTNTTASSSAISTAASPSDISGAESASRSNSSRIEKDFTSIWQRLSNSFRLQEHYDHPAVKAHLETYRNNQRFFDLLAERAKYFLFTIIEEVEARNLPMELALLPVVESTFDPNAHSNKNAVGLWQFMSATGRQFGLQQDWWYDARRDPLASTRAALDYLESLYQRFDEDWLLTLAAYNTGSRNLERAMKQVAPGEQNYWNLPLSAETRSHVPKLLALAQLLEDPKNFNITLAQIPNTNPMAVIEVGDQVDLAMVAELIAVDFTLLRQLNPGYLRWSTHPKSPQSVAVPAGKAQQFRENLSKLDRSSFVTWQQHQIRPGDTLGGIARRYNTTVEVLQVANNLNGTQIIADRTLLIPNTFSKAIPAKLPLTSTLMSITPSVPESIVVQRGDNLWSIAKRFNLRSRDIAQYNNIGLDALLQPGQILDMRFALSSGKDGEVHTAQLVLDREIYQVRRGDSLSSIALRFDTNIEKLLRWNGLSINDLIFPGQVIQVSAP